LGLALGEGDSDSVAMDDAMPKLPRYVFRRANGSYRYKRNVPKELRPYILKDTLYRQLAGSYQEALANFPRVHREIEQLFEVERMRHPSERAEALIAANLGTVWADAAKAGQVGQEPDMLPLDEYMELADDLADSSLPKEVIERVRFANIAAPAMTLERAFFIYMSDKARSQSQREQKALAQRVDRLRRDVNACFGVNYWRYVALDKIRRRDATALRDYLMERVSGSSTQRMLNVVRAAVNHVIREEELDCKNPFASIAVPLGGGSKEDRLPLTEADMNVLLACYQSNPEAYALFVTLADTGARLAEIVGLERQDVDEEKQCLHIRPNGHRGLKTRNSSRTVPLSPRALKAMAPFLARVEQGDAPIFPRYAQERGNDRASAMLMKRLRGQISDKKKTIHSLRHRMKDRLRNTDCPEALSLAILGHSQNTIADNYGSGYALEKMRGALIRVWEGS
jgi:integrase